MQKKTTPLSIKEIISNQPGPLMDLYSHAIDIAILQERLHSYLPTALQEHVTVANYSRLTLHLHTDNAAWATKLRFEIPAILEIARSNCMLSDLQTIRIKVAPSQSKPTSVKKTYELSTKTAKLLRNTGQLIPDKELGNVFIRLSKNSSD